MEKLDFAEAVDRLIQNDPRYHREAYYFLREALDHTVKLRKRQMGESGHVNGAQLCEGIRQLAIKQFGPMVPTVFEYWGLERTDDFGAMVWKLVELEIFGKTEGDSIEDFKGVYQFSDAFVAPFLPSRVPVAPLAPKPDEQDHQAAA